MAKESLPPKLAIIMLAWFCPRSLYETIEGDLVEQFEMDVEEFGVKKAKRRFLWNAIKFFRPGILLRNRFLYNLIQTAMLTHFFKFLFRSMKKNAAYSFINITGLALGLATVLLIVIYVLDEYSYDRFHTNSNDIYRVVGTIHSGSNDLQTAFSPTATFDAVKLLFPEVEFASRVNYFNQNAIRYDQNSFEVQGIDADPDFLKMFSFGFAQGDWHTALDQANAIVITENLAQKLFGLESALNKVVRIGADREAVVTGILKDLPQNSHLQFSFITPYSYLIKGLPQNYSSWGNFGVYNYIKLNTGAPAGKTQTKLQEYFEKNVRDMPQLSELRVELRLQPLTEIHLGGVDYQMERPGKGNKQYVFMFSILAVFILLIGCINFANLSTASAIKRAKEIGLRKTIGALRSQLVIQLLGESMVATMMSMAIALLITWLLLDPFNSLVGKSMDLNFDSVPIAVIICFAATLIIGILAGLYPAAFLSSITTSTLVKGVAHGNMGVSKFSKALVVLQFIFSITIIAGTFVVYSQLQYIRNKNLGYQRENVLNIHKLSDNYEVFKTELLKFSDIKSVTATNQHPADVFLADQLEWPGKLPGQQVLIHNIGVDYDFIETMNMEMLQGRSFSKSHSGDSAALIINEEAARILDFADPIGQNLQWGPSTYTIIGVVKDFHFRSIHEKVGPIRMHLGRTFYRNVMVKMKGNVDENLEFIEHEWKKLNPGRNFEFSFLDDDFDAVYRAEATTESIFKYFSALAITIACLGLFGLSAYTMQRKNKEYSIRKVFGATSSRLFYASCIEHLILVGIAFVISIPIGHFWMREWLNTFAYHTDLSLLPFALAGITTLFIAFATVSYQSVKVALINPSVILRSE